MGSDRAFSWDLFISDRKKNLFYISISWHTSSETLSIPKLWGSYCRFMGWQGLGILTYLASGSGLVVRETAHVVRRLPLCCGGGEGYKRAITPTQGSCNSRQPFPSSYAPLHLAGPQHPHNEQDVSMALS